MAETETEIKINDRILQPGEKGWWKIWGACIQDVRPGDRIFWKAKDGDSIREMFVDLIEENLVTRTFTQVRACTQIMVEGCEIWTLGYGVPVVVFRWGTKNTLADSL